MSVHRVLSTVRLLVQLGSMIPSSIKASLTPAAKKAQEVITSIRSHLSDWVALFSTIAKDLLPITRFLAPMKVNCFALCFLPRRKFASHGEVVLLPYL